MRQAIDTMISAEVGDIIYWWRRVDSINVLLKLPDPVQWWQTDSDYYRGTMTLA